MTTKTRRAFTDEFKREAVALLAARGRPLTQVAAQLGMQPSMLRAWRRRLSRPRSAPAEGARSDAHGARHFKERSRTGSACGGRNGFGLDCRRKGAAGGFLVALDPVKKHGPWAAARLRVATPSGDSG